ncbi:MAG: hypothetical protein ACQR33_03005 [Candidatus Saccharibacteria bacterium]
MTLKHALDSSDLRRELERAAFHVSHDPGRTDVFIGLLSEAIDTLSLESGERAMSVGLDWLHASNKELPAFADFFRKVVKDPFDLFVQHNEYNPCTAEVGCSALLGLVPEAMRPMFVRTSVLRWGPHCARWQIVLHREGFSRSWTEDLAREFLDSGAVSAAMQDRYRGQLLVDRSKLGAADLPDLDSLDDDQLLDIAEDFARRHPKDMRSLFKYPLRGPVLGFFWQLESRFDDKTLERLLVMADGGDKKSPAQRPSTSTNEESRQLNDILRGKASPEALVRLALKLDSRELFDDFQASCDWGQFIEHYQTRLYGLLRQHNGALAQHITAILLQKLEARGWRIGKIAPRRWRFTRAHIEVACPGGGVITYLQMRGSHFSPKEGEEVLYCVRTAKSIKTGVFGVNFLELYSNQS